MTALRKDILIGATEFFAHCSRRSLEENWSFFKDTLNKSADKHIPSKLTSSRNSLPWISRGIKRQMRRRDHLLKKARRSSDKNSPAWSAYRLQQNKVVKLLKSSHNNYLNQEIGGSLKENPKRSWSFIKRTRSEGMGIPTLRQGDSVFISDKDKANLLNKQFESVFTRDNGFLPSTPSISHNNYSSIGEIKFDEAGVRKLLTTLNTSKSCGPDGISARCLRDLSKEISGMLTFILQQSFNSGTLPYDWSQAMVIPVHKKSNKENPANYRPISLTCFACKLMEHIVLSHLNQHLSTNSILSPAQHGFRAGMSCETQLVLTCHDWANILNQQGQVDALLLDFSKAFDKVSHAKLLHKLGQYGINGKTLQWISGFLHNRTQFVAINGSHSSISPVTSGVPQGSVLGPTLFLQYINDIADVTKSELRLFADDTVLYRAIKSDHDHQILQEDLHNLTKWASDWQMDFNASKCHLLRITNKRKPFQSTYSANSEVLAKVPQCDYLGVRCSESLRWGAHCSKVAAKANKTLGLIRRTLKPCCREVKEKAYMMLVRPTIEYASSTWNPHTNTDVNRLEQVQKNAARFVCNDYNSATSTSALVSSLGWDTLEHRRLFNQSVLFYKFHNGLVNCKLPDSVTCCSSRSLTRSHHLAYQRPQSNILTHCYSFFPRTLRVWNSLPCEVVTSPSLDSFRHTALPAIRSLKVPSHLRRL